MQKKFSFRFFLECKKCTEYLWEKRSIALQVKISYRVYTAQTLFRFNNVYVLEATKWYDLIRGSGIWHHTKLTAVLSRFCCSGEGISAGLLRYYWSYPSLCWAFLCLFWRRCVPAEWKWATMEIKPHIHLTNWLYNAGGEGKKWFMGLKEEESCTLRKHPSLSASSQLWLLSICQIGFESIILSGTFCAIGLLIKCNWQRFETCTPAAVKLNTNINVLYKLLVRAWTRGCSQFF